MRENPVCMGRVSGCKTCGIYFVAFAVMYGFAAWFINRKRKLLAGKETNLPE